MAAASLLAALACGGADGSRAAGGVLPGIDVLLRDRLALVQNVRVGLITNHTGLTAAGRTTIEALGGAPGVRIVALFSPEHGIGGTAAPGELIGDTVETTSGLPIRPLDTGPRRRRKAAATPAGTCTICVKRSHRSVDKGLQPVATRHGTIGSAITFAMPMPPRHGWGWWT